MSDNINKCMGILRMFLHELLAGIYKNRPDSLINQRLPGINCFIDVIPLGFKN